MVDDSIQNLFGWERTWESQGTVKMKRFYIEAINPQDGVCTITGSEAWHIRRVMRMGPGDRFILMDRTGARYEVTIESCHRKEVRVVLEKSIPLPPASPLDITLCQALLKSRPMDYLIQKTSELGVNRMIPFISDRTVIRLDQQDFDRKSRHWREIARNAAKQSDRSAPAEIGRLFPFRELLSHLAGQEAFKVILWEGEKARDLKGLLAENGSANKVLGVVGPEGGFTPHEINLALDAGFSPASLGHRILRAETAAQTLVAVVQYEWGDLSLKVTSA